MAVNLLSVYLRFRAMRARLDKAREAILLLQQDNLFTGAGITLTLSQADRNTLKAWALAQYSLAVADADTLIALGGTVDVRPQVEMVSNPEVARSYEIKLEESLTSLFRALALDTSGANVKLSIPPAMETQIKDDLATVPTLVKMWIVVARAQIAALT